MRKQKLFSLIIAVILLAACLTACNNGKMSADNTGSKPTGALTTQETPFSTTPAPTTPAPTASAPTTPAQDAEPMRLVSAHDILLSAAETVLSGGSFDGQSFRFDDERVYFGIENDTLTAYSESIRHGEPGNVSYELKNPIKSFPGELGLRARKSISDGIRVYIDPEFTGDEKLRLFGYIGEKYIIFTNKAFHGYQVAAIFVNTDDGEWKEISPPKEYPIQVKGGCMIDERIGYMCYFDRIIMTSDGYTPRQLMVFRTVDGGKTWENLELWIPEEYEDSIAPPTYTLTPVFEGEHGVMFVKYSLYDKQTSSFNSYTSWFESTDGGTTWEFHIG